MANVFGIPITDETLREMPEYINRQITQTDRAHVALNKINEDNRYSNALGCVNQLKEDFGDGVSTLCVIYNATGDTLTLVTSHDYNGHVYTSPYPEQIANGQWGAFLHVKTTAAMAGSVGAVVYRGKNQNGDVCDWMLGWSSPWNRVKYDNKAYTEIREAGHYSGDNNPWEAVSNRMETAGVNFKDEWNNCVSMVAIGGSTSSIYEGKMTLTGA